MKIDKKKLLNAIMIITEWLNSEVVLGNFVFDEELVLNEKEVDEGFITKFDDKVFGLFMDKVGFDEFDKLMKKFQ